MDQKKTCLLCNTENVQYDEDFLDKRAFFSAPKLLELRMKWNAAISKIHPVLKGYVDNINTYQICDLHFNESDIKKNFKPKSTDDSVYLLPISKWGLNIKAVPLSDEELGRKKPQDSNSNEKLQDENRENEFKESQPEETRVDEETDIVIKIEMDEQEDSLRDNDKIDEDQETGRNSLAKEVEPVKDIILDNERNILTKLIHRPIQPNFRKKIEVKFSPYPVHNSVNKGIKTKAPQILQIKTGKNQVFVVPSGAQVIPISPPSIPVSLVNPVPPSFKLPVISQVTSLSAGPVISKLIPKSFPITNVTSTTNSPSVSKVSVVSKATSIPTVSLIPEVTGGSETAVTKIIHPSPLKSTPESNPSLSPSSVPSNSEITVTDPYDKERLISDLQKYPLPSGWTYTLTKINHVLFTQYCLSRRFPIFLSIEDDLTTKISVGHQAVKFIPHEMEIECFSNIVNGLRKLEKLNWCFGIGFNNNNHSDLCSIVTERMNSRCKACIIIRKNEQRQESKQIQRQKNPPKDLKLLIRNLKRINERLEAKVCKMKLMVTHLKSKQCVECLHEKFMNKTLAEAEPASSAATESD